MATQRRFGATARHFRSILSSTHSINSSQTLILPTIDIAPLQNPNPRSPNHNPFLHLQRNRLADPLGSLFVRHFTSRTTDSSGEDDDEEEGEGEEEDEEEDEEDYDGDEENCNGSVTKYRVSGKSEEEKVAEAAEIGYRVVAPLDPSEKPFKPWEPIFAVVQIGSHQFKVCNGDSIFTERLKFCEVNDKLVLNKVLMLGSKTQTIIGRPVLPDAAVHAVVEEHALDAKVIIFKKKRRKNYRRTKGHRQELTKLRIIDIQGIEKSEEAVEATAVAA